MRIPRTRKVDGKVGRMVTKKHFTKSFVKELELAKERFKNDVGEVLLLFF